ncbi:MAG: hypothetical protein HY900_28610 [Deltaproteobacteria bacterium]|nr:hypothetical protein [Deltaproteobacteria bacterium]
MIASAAPRFRAFSLAAALLGGCAGVGFEAPPSAASPAPIPVPARSEPAAEAAPAKAGEPGGARKWTYGAVRGRVVDVKKDGTAVIRVFVGRKAVDFIVPPESPRAAQLAGLIGKSVEAEGRMEFGEGGARSLLVTDVTEVEGR